VVKNKLIAARKEKNRTQSDLADLLFINQSQYQRRESGEIRISDEEWVRIAKFLEKEVDQIKEEADYTINQYFDNVSGNYIGSNNNYCNIPEYLLKNQQEYIEMLKHEIQSLKEKLNLFNEQT
jgi:transcriptional regulator with XRE-family HTH domain